MMESTPPTTALTADPVVAARVAALAGGGEILATAETLAEASDVSTSGARAALVKGVTAPVSVAEITWT